MCASRKDRRGGSYGAILAVGSQPALFRGAMAFIATFAAHTPTLLLLDDLHWADPASLDLLRFLARSLTRLPLLLVATYRADELTRHHALYQLLPTLVRESSATRFDLRPFEFDDLRALIPRRGLSRPVRLCYEKLLSPGMR